MSDATTEAPRTGDVRVGEDGAGGVGAEGVRAHADIEAMSYEAARDALIRVVDELERGGATLEQSLALWERGEALATRCETWLTGARARLDATRSAQG